MNLNLTPEQLFAGVGALLALAWVWRAGARLLSLFGRVVFTAGLIVGIQWLVITHPHTSKWLLPALFASYALTRALTVTTLDTPRRRGGGRR